MVPGEDPIGSIALVATEDLVTAVTGQQTLDPGFARHLGTEEGAQRRIVPEGLVVGRNQSGQRGERVIGGHDLRVVRGAEVTGRQLGVAELVVVVVRRTRWRTR